MKIDLRMSLKWWLVKKARQPPFTFSPVLFDKDYNVTILDDYKKVGRHPHIGIVIGRYWYEKGGVIKYELFDYAPEILAKYGR
jgi:hypothetical protein